jgi:hypothetical protein
MSRECGIDTVTKLSPFERFVFVMSVLERYSHWDCSLLLGCSMNKVAQARMGRCADFQSWRRFRESMGSHCVV